MNKTELIEHIARQADLSKLSAARALEAVIEAVTQTLKSDGSVTIAGFGTFVVAERSARQGRDPRTGAPIEIGAAKIPRFRAGKVLKDELN
ncbi:HU family DNA-binding protein [Burkholderia sp. F1]|uniref:HU family DNA-binding protein n=1 Tax=Burkholderia sp. F1 TaxID=3366817 RepID=UPI003D73BC3A